MSCFLGRWLYFHQCLPISLLAIPSNIKHLYNIYKTSAQRLRHLSNIVEMIYKCFVFAGIPDISGYGYVIDLVVCHVNYITDIVASELKDPICHSNECQIGSFISEATICYREYQVSVHVVSIGIRIHDSIII